MPANLPDDWHCHMRTCRCGRRYHASEACPCAEMSDEHLQLEQEQREDALIEAYEWRLAELADERRAG